MPNFQLSRIIRCLSLYFFAAAISLLSVKAAEENSKAEALSLGDLQQIVSQHGRVIRSFRLEGVVCAVVPKRRLVTLQDDTATLLLELPSLNVETHVGDRLVIEGENCSLVRGEGGVRLGSAPVVDNDGHHAAIQKSGKVYLPAGLPPIRLAWYNRVADAVLKLEWEGPGIRRQKVPDSALWRQIPGATNSDAMERGLDFKAYNGDGNYLADFENLQPVAQDIAANFDVSYRARPEHTALFFNGFIETPRAGIYTFYLTSDDGAKLQVGEPAVTCTRLAAGSAPPIFSPVQTNSARFSWVVLEGEVTFASVNREDLEIELSANGDRVAVTVVGGAALLAANPLHERIRVAGVCEYSPAGGKMARMVVPSSERLEILSSPTEAAGTSSTKPLLTTVAQVQQLKPEQAAKKIPVRIKGVIIGTLQSSLRLQDSTGGISVHYSTLDWAHQPLVGDLLEVDGVTDNGLFAPVIAANNLRYLGKSPMPEPIRPSWDQLMHGNLDCVYVEIRGILIAVSEEELTIYTADGTVTVDVDGVGTDIVLPRQVFSSSNGIPIVGSLIRLRGCCTQPTDQGARRVIRGRIIMNPCHVTLEEQAPKDPFSQPTKKIADLLWFDPHASALQRTKLKGIVLHAESGECLALEDQRGFRIRPSQPASLQAGDLVEAVGFPKLDGPSPILQEAQIRKTGHASLPVPVPVSVEGLFDGNHDSTLVQIEATLMGETASSQGRILELQAGPSHFLAMQKFVPDSTMSLAIGSRLQLVGVYASTVANRVGTSTDPFSLLLIDGDGAIRVLARPSWWTVKHALMIAAVLAGVLGMALVWIKLLRQKVELRTAQLRKEIQERQRVEQAHAIEQERTRVAQDLHDELGSGLTTMGLLGALVNNTATPSEKKAGYLEQITHLAYSLVTALDEIVWAINPQHDSIASSASYYAYFAQPFLNAAGIACRLEIADQFAEHPLDPHLRHGVFLAFKEALNNVVRHSGATEVTVKILTASDQLIITIHDNGRGMKPGESQPGQSHDGLAGMRDRLAHLGGTFLITSQAGQGTTVEFRIPMPQPRSDYNNADSSAEEPVE